jgi:hypothetical protein
MSLASTCIITMCFDPKATSSSHPGQMGIDLSSMPAPWLSTSGSEAEKKTIDLAECL